MHWYPNSRHGVKRLAKSMGGIAPGGTSDVKASEACQIGIYSDLVGYSDIQVRSCIPVATDFAYIGANANSR